MEASSILGHEYREVRVSVAENWGIKNSTAKFNSRTPGKFEPKLATAHQVIAVVSRGSMAGGQTTRRVV